MSGVGASTMVRTLKGIARMLRLLAESSMGGFDEFG
jgi:hypothetical protein